MKINSFKFIISLALVGLIALAFYDNNAVEKRSIYALTTFLTLGTCCIIAIAIDFPNLGSSINSKVASVVFFLIMLIINIFFSNFTFSNTTYIITNGIVFLVYALLIQAIYKPNPERNIE